jgi:hypothetical protein
MPEIDTLDTATELDVRASRTVQAVAPDTLSPLHHVQAIYAAFDSKDIRALAALMAEDLRLQIGNADVVDGKVEFVEALQVF